MQTHDATGPTATFVCKMHGWRGDAALYRLSEPVSAMSSDDGPTTTEYVIVSGIDIGFFGYPVHETMVFPAYQPDGDKPCDEPMSWCELACARGTTDHAAALAQMGFAVVR